MNNKRKKKIKKKYNNYYPGFDIAASLWKIIQQTCIQNQLDSTHDMYKNLKTKTTMCLSNDMTITNNDNNNIIIKNLDHLHFPSSKLSTIKPFITSKLYSINKSIYTSLLNLLKLEKNLNENFIKLILLDTPFDPSVIWGKNNKDDYDSIFKRDISLYSNLSSNGVNNLIDLRMSKVWVEYMMSDGIIRYSTLHPHPIYNACPGWLIDVINIQMSNLDISLIYCTDIRGVNLFLGQLCSLINLHNLFRKFETSKTNYTAILLQMTVLSNESLNPINRRGNKFPGNAIASRSFEDIKRYLLATQKLNIISDNLHSFVSRLTTCLPPQVGTNFFNIIFKNT